MHGTTAVSDDRLSARTWAIVLAGGRGVRLAPLVRLLYGDERPKQYATLIGSKSLLLHTVERAALGVAPERTVVVISRGQESYVADELGDRTKATVLVQPSDRGTAAGILLPAHWVRARDPKAILVVLPSDHFVEDDSLFMRHIRELVAMVSRQPERIVLVGAPATEPETDYGWIEPAEPFPPLHWTTSGPVWRVERFWEKPSAGAAQVCLEKRCLWNTLVMVARASTLTEAGRLALPQLSDRLTRVPLLGDHEKRSPSLQLAYDLERTTSFSRSILESYPSLLGVSRLPAMIWSDLGTPERVFRCLRGLGAELPWLTGGGALRNRAKQEASRAPLRGPA
jgi:mannose-1-phosphate guanylyltransferase